MDYLLHVIIITGIYMLLTMSLNLVVGYTGLPAISHGAFYGLGAYTSALISVDYHLSPWLGLLSAVLVCALVAAAVALSSLRLSGDYFSLATIAFAVVFYSILKNAVGLTRGPMGLPGIPPFSFWHWRLVKAWQYVLFVAFIVSAGYWVMLRIVNSPFGRVMRAIREDVIGAEALGKNVGKIKLSVFVLAASFAGLAGSLYAHYVTFIDPSSYGVMESIVLLLMVVFGGMGSLVGSLLSAAVLVGFPECLRLIGMPEAVAAPVRQMAYGLLLVGLMVWRPEGLLGRYKWT